MRRLSASVGATAFDKQIKILTTGPPLRRLRWTVIQHLFQKLLNDAIYHEISQRLLLALLFGGLIGLERSYHGRPAGFRTHALVCLSTSLLMLVSVYESLWFTPTNTNFV